MFLCFFSVYWCMLCLVCYLFVISTSVIDCLGRFVAEMTYYVSSLTLNLTKLNSLQLLIARSTWRWWRLQGCVHRSRSQTTFPKMHFFGGGTPISGSLLKTSSFLCRPSLINYLIISCLLFIFWCMCIVNTASVECVCAEGGLHWWKFSYSCFCCCRHMRSQLTVQPWYQNL